MRQLESVAVGELMASKTGSVDPSKFPGEVFDLYSIPAFDRGFPEITTGAEIGSSKQVVRPGDVLLSKIVPHIRRSWIVGKDDGRRLIASGEWIVFRSNLADPNYLRHAVIGDPFHKEFMRTVSGVGGSLLRARPAHVAKIKIPLPPLPEQRRIAAILDQADALRAKRREALAQLDSLTQSIFIDMFGDPVANPKGWAKQPLVSLSERIQIGPFGSQLHEEDYIDGGIPLINPTHIKEGKICTDASLTVPESKYQQLGQYHLSAGDLIMGRRGEMGRCAVITDTEQGWLCGTGSLFVRPDSSRLHPIYLGHVISSYSMRRHLEKVAQGVTMANLNKAIVGFLSIPTPPVHLQQAYADQLVSVEGIRASQNGALLESLNLFSSLQHRAFRGEL